MNRETAYRIFSNELNISTRVEKGDEEMSPSYVVSPLGTMINRVMIAGVLTEVYKEGSDEEPWWRGKVLDVCGNFYINTGRFQPEASNVMSGLETPSYITVIGKVKTYTTNDDRTFVSIYPEHIIKTEEQDYIIWILESLRFLWTRLLRMNSVLKLPNITVDSIVSEGYTSQEAYEIMQAIDEYGHPESGMYLRIIQDAMRRILPNENIDLGLSGSIEETYNKEEVGEASTIYDFNKEDMVLAYLDELDVDIRGVSISELIRRGEKDGITAEEIEEITNNLMNKSMIYEPNLGYLKKI